MTAGSGPGTLAAQAAPPGTAGGNGTALITGGAGGTGSAIARRLRADGFRVVITDVDRAAGERVRHDLQVEFIRCDCASEPDMRHAVRLSGPVQVLVNSVGIRGATGAIWQIPVDDFRRTIEVNTVSHIVMSQLVAPAMMQRRSGAIIMIAYGAARTGAVGRSPYGISKWGLLGLTESLANELAPWGIRANAVLPGMVAGERFAGSIALHAQCEGITEQQALDRIMSRTRLRRLVDPAEVAAAVSYLASDDAIGVTGVFLDVSGGIRVTGSPGRDRAQEQGAAVLPGELAPLEAAGVRIPRIGFGTYGIPLEDARPLVRRALEVGYRHIDTAMRYDNERTVGQGVRDSGVPRSEIFVASKFPHTHASSRDVVDAAWSSVRELGLGYVDLFLMHWPNGEVPPEETFGALTPLIADGVIRAVGLSNAPSALVRRVLAVTGLANVQVEHHPYLRQEALHELVAEQGMTLTAYAPLAEGRVFTDPVLTSIAAKHGKNAGQVTLRYLLRRPRTIVIPKTSRMERVPLHLDILDFDLDDADVAEIDALGAARRRFFDPPWQAFAWDER